MNKKGVSIIIFGITGDLARQKLVPALFDLFIRKELPADAILVGYGRKEFATQEFKDLLSPSLDTKLKLLGKNFKKVKKDFLDRWTYVKGELDDPRGYEDLSRVITARSLFYISLAPAFQMTIVENLDRANILCKGTQILIEKPFGESAAGAKRLEKKLLSHVKESQIYRIDHYLAKEGIVDLFSLRSKNRQFEKLLSEKYVERVEARLLEQKTVGKRGVFYDSVGALRDIGQNHLLQMITSVVSPKGGSLSSSKKISAIRAKTISSFKTFLRLGRAQYEGYLQEEGVRADSTTETLFHIDFLADLAGWRAVPISIIGGKGIKENRSDIVIKFKKAVLVKGKKVHELVIQTSGFAEGLSRSSKLNTAREAYERVFLGALKKDRRKFVSLEEAVQGWRFVEAIERKWKRSKTSLAHYRLGSHVDF